MTLPQPVSQTWPFIGHAELGRHLIQSLNTQRLVSVLLFVGPRAVGKASGAKWLMQRSLCTASTGQPCGSCTSCQHIQQNIHPNGAILDSEVSGSIGIEEIRQAIHQYDLVSWDKAPRWFIIADADRLTEAASNTMLKFLEEIPPNLHVVMTSSTPERLLATLRSRATVYQWHFVTEADLTATYSLQHQSIARSAGRPGWMQALHEPLAQKNDRDQASNLVQQFSLSQTKSRERLPKERSAIEDMVHQEELVVRDLLLNSVGSHRRLLWPDTVAQAQMSASSALILANKYVDRYELSPNLQPRLLYEDLHLV